MHDIEHPAPPTGQSLRRLRWRTALAGAITFAIPFGLFVALARFSPEHTSTVLYVAPFLLLGVILALLVWQYTMNLIERLAHELTQALLTARQRESERDRVVQQLARRLEEERELARQKSQFQSRLAEYEKYAALAQLALGAAHEINNPLLGILSHLELERRHARTQEVRDETDQCIEGGKRIATAVRGLLNYARPGAPQLTKVSVERLVEDTLAFLHHHPMFRNIQLEARIPPDLPALTADSAQLSQILMNLLLNAAEAMPQGGQVVFAARCCDPGDKIEISVSDTGAGIPRDVLPNVFRPFFTTKPGHGTGLGLSITESYVHGHGGEIHIESEPGRGTRVYFTLPIVPVNRTEKEPAALVEVAD